MLKPTPRSLSAARKRLHYREGCTCKWAIMPKASKETTGPSTKHSGLDWREISLSGSQRRSPSSGQAAGSCSTATGHEEEEVALTPSTQSSGACACLIIYKQPWCMCHAAMSSDHEGSIIHFPGPPALVQFPQPPLICLKSCNNRRDPTIIMDRLCT